MDLSNLTVRIADIVDDSIVDGPGIRLVIFVQGCRHKCDGCHNPQTHDYNGGTEMRIIDIFNDRIKNNKLIDGVTFSGGEPFEQAYALRCLGELIKTERPDLNIITFTGYRYKDLNTPRENIESYESLKLITVSDFVVDGKFDKNLVEEGLRFRGSANQQVWPTHLPATERVVDNDWETYEKCKEGS